VANSATAIFDAEDSSIQKVAARITSVLLFLEKKFAGTKLEVQADATTATSQIDQLNGRYQALAQNIQATSTGGGFSGMLTNAAHTASFLTTSIGGITSALLRVAPLVKFLPDTFARWVPGVKAAVAEHEGLIAKTALATTAQAALAGRLSIVDAVMSGLNLQTLGASNKMAILGGVGAFAGSKIVAGMRAAANGVTNLIRRMGTAIGQMVSLGSGGMMGRAGGMLGGLLGAGGLFAMGRGTMKAFDTGGKFSDLSQQTGLSVGELVVIGQEARNAGKDVDSVAGAVNKMQKALASGDADDVLGQLQLDLSAVKDASPLEQFQMIGKAISALQSPTDRSAAAMKIFGKSGAGLLAMFASRGFGEAAAQVGNQAAILDRNAALFDAVSDRLGTAGTKVEGFFVGVAEKVAPVLLPLLDRFVAMDLAKMGQDYGDFIAMTAQLINDGKLADSLGLMISIALGKGVNILVGGLLGAAAGFGQAMMEVVRLTGEGVAAAMNPKNMIDALQGKGPLSADALRAKLTSSLQRVKWMTDAGWNIGQVINVAEMEEMLADNMTKAITGAQDAQDKALAQVPTTPPAGGATELDLEKDASAGGKLNVSNLQRIGGAVGYGGGGDPLIEANRLARESLSVERQILDALLGRSNKITGRGLEGFYQ